MKMQGYGAKGRLGEKTLQQLGSSKATTDSYRCKFYCSKRSKRPGFSNYCLSCPQVITGKSEVKQSKSVLGATIHKEIFHDAFFHLNFIHMYVISVHPLWYIFQALSLSLLGDSQVPNACTFQVWRLLCSIFTSWEHHGMLGSNGLFIFYFFGGQKWCKISTLAWDVQFLQQDFEQPFHHYLCSMNTLDAMTHLPHPSLTSRCRMFL